MHNNIRCYHQMVIYLWEWIKSKESEYWTRWKSGWLLKFSHYDYFQLLLSFWTINYQNRKQRTRKCTTRVKTVHPSKVSSNSVREVTKRKRSLFARMVDVAQIMNARGSILERSVSSQALLHSLERSILDIIEILRHDAPSPPPLFRERLGE